MKLPVGYINFHPDAFLNYQFNRWYSLGFTNQEELAQIAPHIKTFADYTTQFLRLAEKAHAENRLQNAAFYTRAAEFLVEPHDPQKLPLYKTFRQQFYQAFANDHLEQQLVPYGKSYLSVMRLTPPAGGKPKGTIVAFGGFDSFIEEFYCMWLTFAEDGYEVLAFDGPGQGGTLRLHGLPFDHDWEKPTAAVLDYFNIAEATLIGVSMGGYWAIRAAAFEPRIKRVIALPPVYDWLEMTNGFNRWLVAQLLQWRGLMNSLVRLKMANGKLRHTINQALFLTQKQEPIEAVEWMLGMNKTHLHSEKVTQHVLLLGGANDAFQPPILLEKQKEALTKAMSVTTHIFTKAEQADQHCQMGNLGLALTHMLKWVNRFD